MVELPFTDVDELTEALDAHAYLADRGLATAIYLSLSLGKPPVTVFLISLSS